MADRGRGGYRQPQRPAAVSPPGSGARTDGGAGSKSQPLRVASGGAYGERKAAVEQQQGAPLAVEAGVSDGAGSPAPGGPAPSGMAPGMFDPTNRPGESLTAGAVTPGENALDPDALLRLLYAKRPSPYLARLLRD